MKKEKKITIRLKNDEFILDLDRIAHWERFVPYKENHDFFVNYNHIIKTTKQIDSLSRRIRCWSLSQTLNNIIKNKPNYHVAECGSFTGCSAYLIAKILEKYNFSKKFFIFDSFEGLSKFSKEDLTGLDKHPAKEGDFRISEIKFKNNVGNFEFMDIKKGWIPERFNEVENEKFSFINIDVDIYKPTKESLDFFYPRLINGGCIHLDDYNFNEWPGAKIAIKEFEKKNKISFSYEIPLGGYFLIK